MVSSAGEEAIEEGAELPGERRRAFSGKRMVLLIVLPLLIISGGGAALYVTGLVDMLFAEAPVEDTGPSEPVGPGVFFDMPDMLVNLSTTERQPHFLKLSLSLELNGPQDVAQLQQMMPRIIDGFQAYLRELRLEDLRGSAGLHRIREELLRRVTTIAQPIQVRDLLLREMLVQR